MPSRLIRFFFLLVAGAIFFIPASLFANDKINFHGYIEMDNRLAIEGVSRFVYNETTLGMALEAFPADKVSMLGSFQIDAIGFDDRLGQNESITIEQQQSRTAVDPVRFELDEAYIMTAGLGLKDLDLKLGKQRIQWGTGDQFNPTDTLNPDDFHDPLQFGRKIPTLSFKADYYAGPVTLSAVFLPLFTPALLPVTDIRAIFEKQFETMADEFEIDTGDSTLDFMFEQLMLPALQTAELGKVNINSRVPDKTASNVSAAFKIAGTIGQVDLSASYAYVFDDFPAPREIAMTVAPFTSGTTQIIDIVDLEVKQEYMRTHVIGADFSSSIPVLDIGFWGEVAYIIPEPFETKYFLDMGHSTNALLSTLSNTDITDGAIIARDDSLGDHYVKAVAGVDYTFPHAVMLLIQYVRGLPSDNTAELVKDYIMGMIDKPFLHDSIKPRLVAFGCPEDGSWSLYPQIFFFPADSLEFQLGAFFIFGDVDTKIGAFGDDFVMLRAKLSF